MITYSEANQISIKAYLASKGIHPVKDRGYYGMYRSPFREDSNASLKVDYNKNLWHDFGSNEGGTMIDLVMRMNNCSPHEALTLLEQAYARNNFGTHQRNDAPTDSFSFHGNNTPAITIQKIIPIAHKALTDYLSERKINIDIAKQYCTEVHYSVNSKPFFAIGFQNDSKGWILRSESFKGCTSMDIRTYRDADNPRDTCLAFEGFTDFLSYLTLKNTSTVENDVIVLNSLSNLPKAINRLKGYKEIHAYLDNDEVGKKATQIIKQSCPNVVDQSAKYVKHKDLNEYLISIKQAQEKKLREEVKRKPSRGFKR